MIFGSIMSITTKKQPRVTPPVPPRNYYISAAGSGDGLTSGTPANISILTGATLNSGDNIYFNKGDEFYLTTLTVPVLNTMTIGSYGTGARPKLRGSTPIGGGWTNTGGGIYSKVIASPRWIFLNGVASKLASSAWIPSTSIVSTTVIRGSAVTLNAMSSIIGAKIRVFTYPWLISDELTITAYDSGTGNITMNGSYAPFGLPAAGVPFIIYNQLQHVTEDNEWYYNGTTLYYKSSVDPATLDLRASYQDHGIVPAGLNVTITGLEMLHYDYAIRSLSNVPSFALITDCKITDCTGLRAVIIGGSNNAITYCEFRRHQTQAFYIIGDDVKEEHNIVDTIGMDANYPFGFCCAFVVSGLRAISQYTTVNNVAFSGSLNVGIDFLVQYNQYNNALKRMRDGAAGVYTSGPSTPVQSLNRGGTIRRNIIQYTAANTEGNLTSSTTAGIYLDNRTETMTVEDNTIVGTVEYGGLGNWNTRLNTFKRNNIVGATIRSILFREDTDIGDSPLFQNNYGNVVEENVLACRIFTALCIEARQMNGVSTWNPFASGGNSDNNHYVNPYGVNIAGYRSTEAGALTQYTLAGWRTKMGDDAASTGRTNYIVYSNAANAAIEVAIEINNTSSPVNFNVPAGYSDYNGNAFSNPVSIPAYGSLVYFKNTAA